MPAAPQPASRTCGMLILGVPPLGLAIFVAVLDLGTRGALAPEAAGIYRVARSCAAAGVVTLLPEC